MDREIKVGEYIRTDDGEIRKIIGTDEDNHLLTDIRIYGGNWLTFNEEARIIKHSPNITDLIAEGDYVNGKLIHKVDIRENSAYVYYGNSKTFTNYQIKSIVTKEQFEEAEYTVERKV